MSEIPTPSKPKENPQDVQLIDDDKFVPEDLAEESFAFTQLLILTLTLPPITAFASVVSYNGSLGLADPLYGSFFKNQYTLQILTTAIIMGVTVGLSPFFKRPLPHRIPSLLSLASLNMALAPTYASIVTTFSEPYGPHWPPHAIYAITMYSPAFLMSWANASLLHDSLKLFLSYDTWIHGLSLFAFHGSLLVSALGGSLNWFTHLPLANQSASILIVGSLSLATYVVIGRWIFFPVNKMKLRTKLAAPALIAIIAALTLLYHPGCTNNITHRHNNLPGYRVLAREESITGWVSVLEEDERKIRVMRNGHCLLGGMYTQYNESIFHNFYIMDAIHLTKRSDMDYRGKILMIGLGIGSSAQPLIDLNYSVEMIELDPVVYKYAQEYFHLGNPTKAHLVDAKIPLTQEPSPLSPPYQFILHDVFNGGGVDGDFLFTKEALEKVSSMLEPGGVLALNLVSGLEPPYDTPYRKVTTTLKSVYPYVRCFREPYDHKDHEVKVQNLVFFASHSPIHFTPVTEEVFNVNQGLAYILDRFEKFEVDLDKLSLEDKYILRVQDALHIDKEAAKSQKDLMLYHWDGMNRLLPWETWLRY